MPSVASWPAFPDSAQALERLGHRFELVVITNCDDDLFEASQRLADAANVMSQNPVALQLRYLQTLVEIAAEKNSTTIFPIPIDTLAPFIKGLTGKEV